jgi:hypothetical protein
MKKIQFTKTTIRRVTPQYVEYVDDEGRLEKIDFETCRDNEVERINSGNKERRPGAPLCR